MRRTTDGTSWYETVGGTVPPAPPLAERMATETCVIGAGLAGLGTAMSLAERGRPVVLLEAARIGAGASGRNGGMVSAGFNRPFGYIAKAVGLPAAEALYRLSLEGVALLRRRIATHKIACGLVEGVVEASWFADEEELARAARQLGRLGAQLEAWSGERLRAAYRSARFRAGILDRGGFHLDPLALCRGLAAAAVGLGVRLHETTPVVGLERQGGGWRVRTAEGEVSARRVVLCTSAARPALRPALARATLPVHTHILVTEPLGARLADAVRAPYAVYDDRMATGYFRPLAEGRLLWGGRVDALGPPPGLAERMRRDLACVFPQLADVGIERVWSGAMGFARHRMPVVRPLEDDLWVAIGFGGHGLNTTTLAGELVATALVEGDPRWRLLAPFALPWNGGPLGPLAAQGFYLAYRLRDAVASRHAARAARHTGGRWRAWAD
jgi:gamma-glutamylputrescine oxidase